MMFRLYCSARQLTLKPATGARHRALIRLTGGVGYLVFFLLAGYYARSWLWRAPSNTPPAQPYVLSQEHFIYKQKPLPAPEPEENVEESDPPAAQTDEAGADVDPNDNASLEARVRQAMAEVDDR